MREPRRPAGDLSTCSDSEQPAGRPVAASHHGEPTDHEVAGKLVGDFELLREIGRGSMGVVYEAHQISLGRRVALKILPPALGADDQAKRRFEREARAAAKLHHTHIVPVHAVGEFEGQRFYAMDLIDGQSLDQVLQTITSEGASSLMDAAAARNWTERRPKDARPAFDDQTTITLSASSAAGRDWFDTVARLMADLADALHYAHTRGVIHRDIKPANLMLSREGHVSITDFSLARLLEEPGLTASGSILGTPAYMAPEQIAAGRIQVDHRADIYSLGAVLYEMLTMERPFPGDSREQILTAVMTKDPRPPRRFNRKIPVDLETICLKAVEKDPDRRYQSAGEMARDLRRFLHGGLIAARRARLHRRIWKSVRRHPVAATVLIGLLAVAATAVASWRAGGREEAALRLLADARLALREGTYAEGLRRVEGAMALAPESIDARRLRARLLILNHRHREAAVEARSLLGDDPEDLEAHAVLAGLALYPIRQYRLVGIDPEPHLRVVEAGAPESAAAYYLRALRMTDTRRQIEMLDRALDLAPGDQLALLAKLNALDRLKDYDRKLSEADRLITARPRSAQGWRFRASAFRRQRAFDEARVAIERALNIDDSDLWNYIHRSWIRWDLGQRNDALEDLTRALELNPGHAYLYRERARRLNDLGRFAEGARDARDSIDRNPDDSGAFAQLLRSQLSLRRDSDVLATIEELQARAENWVDREARSGAHRLIAEHYHALKAYDEALESIERALTIDDRNTWSHLVKSWIQWDMGERDEALAELDRAIELDPQHASAYLERARSFNDMGRFEAAAADATRALELEPAEREAFAQLLRSYVNLDREPDVRKTLERLGRQSEHWSVEEKAWARRTMADSYRKLKDYDRAIESADQAIETDPESFSGYVVRMRIHRELGDRAAAEVDCDAVARVPLHGPDDLENRGARLTFDCRDYDRAFEDFARVVETAPSWYKGYFHRGTVHLILKRFDEAVADLSRSIALAPRHARSYNNRAVALAAQGRYTESLADRKMVLELNPHDSLGWTNYGVALFEQGRLQEALEAHDRALELSPRRIQGHENRAQTLAWLGRCADSATEFRETGALAPDQGHRVMTDAHLLGFYYACPERYDAAEALRHARAAYDAEPDRMRPRLADALFRAGDYAAAGRVYAELYEDAPDASAWFLLAMNAWRLDERAEARRFFDISSSWMAERQPNHPVLIKQREEATGLLGLD